MLRLATSQRTPLRARLAAAAVGLANTATAPLTTAGSDKGCLDSCRRWLGSAAAAATDAARLPPLEPWPHAGEPISRAATPPSSWYAQPGVLEREESAVFQRSWLAVAHANRVAAPGAYTAGSLLSLEWLACRDEQGGLHAFHNVCRHHAAILAQGAGTASCFQCPYHGWTYGLDGRLQRATRLKGIEDFRAADHGLVPLQVEEWGGFVWVRQRHFYGGSSRPAAASASSGGGSKAIRQQEQQQQQQQAGQEEGVAAWLGPGGSAAALAAGIADSLVLVASREYEIACNWKVFIDNYLDGGYHVSVAHPELASGLDLATYRSTLCERLSIQSCQPAAAAAAAEAGEAHAGTSGGSAGEQGMWRRQRIAGGRPPAYVFIYPNLMLNRYGPWLDANYVVPLAANRCKVLFDYFLDPSLAGDAGFIEESLAASHRVQLEDVALCESVQRGLASAAYDTGRYAPGVEGPMFHFHQLLHADLAAEC